MKKLSHVFVLIIFLFLTFQQNTFGQDCGFNAPGNCRQGLPHPDCIWEDRSDKCLKIKFHYLNNTNQPLLQLDDVTFYDLLDELNSAFANTKIRFDFDGECIHRSNVSFELDSPSDIWQEITDENGEITNPNPEVGYEMEFINLYFVQGFVSHPAANYNLNSALVQMNKENMAHEVGHILSLKHTHGDNFSNSQTIPKPLDCMCKDPNALNEQTQEKLCEITGDCLCDTGIDPFAHSLDSDNIADRDKWVLADGSQSPLLTNDILDGCNDSTTPWSIPSRNFMSRYKSERNEFSNCQIDMMHEIVEVFKSDLVTDCSIEPFLVCQDITISQPTTWSNDVVEMCKGQKIIIESTGSLTLDNTTITRGPIPSDPVSPECPELKPSRLWGGIYIEGKSISSSGIINGSLIIKNNSIIEFAKNGISATRSFGKILVSDSKIENCGRIVEANDYWPFTFANSENGFHGPVFETDELCGYSTSNPPSLVLFRNCELNYNDVFGANSFKSQIKVNGANLSIIGSTIVNGSSDEESICINNGRGRCQIINGSIIDGFKIGIQKGNDIFSHCAGRGLYVNNSAIVNCSQAINNIGTFLTVTNNFIDGGLINSGFTYGYLANNNFNSLILSANDVQETFTLKENLFASSAISLSNYNQKTTALCNTWSEISDIIGVEVSIGALTPKSWGTNKLPSGNIYLDELAPWMLSYGSDIKQYSSEYEVNDFFDYQSNFSGTEIFEAPACVYNLYPESLSSLGTDGNTNIKLEDEERSWNELDRSLQSLLGQIQEAVGIAKERLIEEYQSIEIEQGEVIGRVLSNIDFAHKNVEGLWLERANVKVIELSELQALWYLQDFQSIVQRTLGSTDTDKAQLRIIAKWAQGNIKNSVSIMNLSAEKVETLSGLTQNSFGDYTNIIRSFLNNEYDLNLNWPENIEIRNSNSSPLINEKLMNPEDKKHFQISPNLISSNCFQVTANDKEINGLLSLTISTSHGRVVDQKTTALNENVCLDNLDKGIYYLSVSNDHEYNETHMLIKI